MEQKFTGIKLNFSDKGDCIKIVEGKKILPHRVDVIEDRLKRNDLSGLEDMFFNFDLKDCRTASTREHIKKESMLLDKYYKIIGADLEPDVA